MTSHDQLGDPGKKTGFWLEEFNTEEEAVGLTGVVPFLFKLLG